MARTNVRVAVKVSRCGRWPRPCHTEWLRVSLGLDQHDLISTQTHRPSVRQWNHSMTLLSELRTAVQLQVQVEQKPEV
eukprot:3939420-Rhodomonas_salina.1